MPITVINLQCDRYEDDAIERFVNAVCALKADVLESPIDRIRVIVNDCPAKYISIGGVLASKSGAAAPFYESFLLEGRPMSQQQAVLAGIAELLAEHLGEDKAHIRGVIHMVAPERWGIAGKPAAGVRADEIEARKQKN
jgi:phenylpyruvate tautomerase PptA (4-oxalocrotonate tautomerase family)